MPSSSNSSTTSLPGPQPASQTSTQQLAQQAQQAGQTPAQSVGKTKKKERTFKLTLLSVIGDVIECSFDTYKNYRITFKFDISEDESIDIAKSMVRIVVFYKHSHITLHAVVSPHPEMSLFNLLSLDLKHYHCFNCMSVDRLLIFLSRLAQVHC